MGAVSFIPPGPPSWRHRAQVPWWPLKAVESAKLLFAPLEASAQLRNDTPKALPEDLTVGKQTCHDVRK